MEISARVPLVCAKSRYARSMPEGNGQDRHAEEHQRIWRAILESHELTLATRELALKTYDHMTGLERQISELVSAIRALVDRIPPENLH